MLFVVEEKNVLEFWSLVLGHIEIIEEYYVMTGKTNEPRPLIKGFQDGAFQLCQDFLALSSAGHNILLQMGNKALFESQLLSGLESL